MARRRNAVWAAALCAGLLLALTGCGGSGTAAADSTEDAKALGDTVGGMLTQVEEMGIVEWHGQLLTKPPEKGGRRIFDLNGRFSPSTGYTELSMDSSIDRTVQQVDYLVINARTYFNSEAWGPNADDCWAEITDDAARSWALPTELDPTWPLTQGRAVEMDGEAVTLGLGYKQVLAGLPRGLFTDAPTVPYDTEARAFVEPHGRLIEVGVDLQSLWKQVSKAGRASFDSRGTGWWAMTMKESQDGSNIVPPKYVFDPATTPPSQCKRV